MFVEVVQQFLTFLSVLDSNRAALTMLFFHDLESYPTTFMSFRMDKASSDNTTPFPILDPIMTRNNHKLLTKFLKMKSPLFQGTKLKILWSSSWTFMRGFISWGSCRRLGMNL